MSVKIIDTLKPKNNGSFPIVEAVDVAVSESLRLPEALDAKADASALAATDAVVATKADASDVAVSTAELQGEIDQIVISASSEAVVAPEVAAARVGDDGTSYQTLKARLDEENSEVKASIIDVDSLLEENVSLVEATEETFNISEGKIINSAASKSLVMRCENKTQYHIKKKNNATSLIVAFTDVIPSANVTVLSTYTSAESNIRCTSDNAAKYIVIRFYYTGTDTETAETIKASVSVQTRKEDEEVKDARSDYRTLKDRLDTENAELKNGIDILLTETPISLEDANIESLNIDFDGSIINSANSKSVIIECQADTNYHIKKKVNNTTLIVGFTSAFPANGVDCLSNYRDLNSNISCVSDSSARYMIIRYYYSGTDTETAETIFETVTASSITINSGSGTGSEIVEHNDDKLNIRIGDVVWEQGSIDRVTFERVDLPNRIRTKYPLYVRGDHFIIHNDNANQDFLIYGYSDKHRHNPAVIGWHSNKERIDASGWIDIVIASASDITPETVDFSNVFFPCNLFRYLPAIHKVNDFNGDDETVSSVYDYLDNVMKKHVYFMTKTYLFTEDSGKDCYYYTIGSGAKKICIVSGQHGQPSDPKDQVLTLCRWIKDLVDNVLMTDFAEKLRNEYTIYVIPILNVYGWDVYNPDAQVGSGSDIIGGRHNYNGIDLNRDWADLTQPETTAATDLIESVDPDIILDLHCTGDYPNTPDSNAGKHWFNIGAEENAEFLSYFASEILKRYDMTIVKRNSNPVGSLGEAVHNKFHKIGGLLEIQWYIAEHPNFHGEEVETVNYCTLHNLLKFLCCKNDSEQYEFEPTPNQNALM